MDKIPPQSGKAMISMRYDPGMNGIYHGVEGASHLSAMLNNLPAYIPGDDSYEVDLPATTEAAVRRQYATNFQAILPILQKTGWPRKGEFSECAMYNAFHLLMGSGDFIACLTWLSDLQKGCEAGELPWIMYAGCYDQSRLLMGKPQRYLMDYQILEDGSVELPAWEGDADKVNDFRAKIGLPLLPEVVTEAMKIKSK